MDSTSLSLLTPDGVVTVFISPALDSVHYGELHNAVCEVNTADELRIAVKAVCDRWGRSVQFG